MENKNEIEIKKVEMPQYQICEHMADMQEVKISIFRLNLEELIYEKMYLLFEKLFINDNKCEDAKIQLQLKRDKLLLETDFSKELGKSRTNKEEREAYIKPFLAECEDKVDEYTALVKNYETKIKIINDLISLRKLELKIETTLQEED